MRSNIFILLLLGGLFSCNSEKTTNTYYNDIEQWRKERLESLTQPDGWTTLVGLYWLEEGVQSFGSSTENDIVFSKKAPSFIGTLSLAGDSVNVRINDTVDVLINGEMVKSMRLYDDTEENTTYMQWESLTWYLIQRGGKFGIRLKDSLSEQRFALKEIPHFDVDENWKFKATFIPPAPEATIKVENILGQVSDDPLEGQLEFTYKGKNYSLAVLDGGQDAYFLIIADETTGEETYGGGRYIYVNRADSSGVTYIDFNKAYNPPCVFSIFATCPLPPQENYLPFRVLAGEKELPDH